MLTTLSPLSRGEGTAVAARLPATSPLAVVASHIFTCQTAQQTAIRPPAWCGRRGRPVVSFLSSSPHARGWRAKGAVPMVTHGRPGCYRATSRKRPDASLRGCVGDTLARHAASLRFRVHGGRTRPGLTPAGLPGGRPL